MAGNSELTGRIMKLAAGESCDFDIKRISSVRSVASLVSLQTGRTYTTRSDRREGRVTVTRLSD